MSAPFRQDGRLTGRGGLAFTEEQAAAITRRTGPMLLAANAGSGKTAVLAERFARGVVDDGLDPGALLAITFTDKAAGELRHRIRERLRELGAREAARDADQAWISTIHGLCTRMLRAHAAAAGVDPAFDVLDESVARRLREDAFDTALAELLDVGDAATLTLVATWGPDRLASATAGVHESLRSQGLRHPRLPPPVARRSLDEACAALGRAREAFAPDLAAAADGTSVQRARDALATCAEMLTARPEPLRPADLDPLRFARRGKVLQGPAAQAYLDALGALAEAVIDEEAIAHHALVDRLLERYGAHYEAAKVARSALDYDDLELVARDLLRDHPLVAASYRERFARVMVDEFQDTNPRQLELLALLGHDDLFVVGDALQSIYGFRHADVRVFGAAQAHHRRAGTEARLRTNWRTVPEILRTLDHMLGRLHDGYTPFVAGRTEEPRPGRAASTLLLVDAAVGEDDGSTPDDLRALLEGLPAGTSSATALEARAIARWVRTAVDAGEHAPQDVVLLVRAATDMPVYERALELEGLSTLASGGRGFWLRQQTQDLTAWLGALANPRDGHAILAALASPLAGLGPDGLAIVSAVARRGTRGDVWALLDATFPRPGDDASEDGRAAAADELRARADAATLALLGEFTERFRGERERLPWLALDELVERVVAETGYDEHCLSLPGGPRRLANVHKLMRLASEHEALVGRDLRSFIDHARAEAEASAREPEAPVELPGVPAVRLMTVHAAKGLQFPVVVACDLERVAQRAGPPVLVDGQRVGLRVPRHGDDSVKAFAFGELDAERADGVEAEERRILHVALTRAEERLVMTAVARRRSNGELEGGRPSAWIVEGALGSLVPPADLLESGSRRVGSDPDSEIRLDVRWLDGRDLRDVLPLPRQGPVGAGTPGPSGGGAADPLAALGPVLATVTEGEPASETPVVAHLSYSSLVRYERCGLRFQLERIAGLGERDRPVAGRSGDRLDARARGSIVHRVLELTDFGTGTDRAAEVIAAADEHDVVLTEDEVADLVALIGGALATPLMARVRSARRTRREATFTIPLTTTAEAVPLLLGVVDLVAEEAGGTTLVVDYKTDRLPAESDLEAAVAEGYGVQRTIYALAALSAGAARVDVAHLYLDRPGEPVVATFEAADAPALRADLRGRAAGILARDFRPTSAPDARVCAGCPGRGGLCPVPFELTTRSPDADRVEGEPPSRPAAPRPRRPRRPPGQTSLF